MNHSIKSTSSIHISNSTNLKIISVSVPFWKCAYTMNELILNSKSTQFKLNGSHKVTDDHFLRALLRLEDMKHNNNINMHAGKVLQWNEQPCNCKHVYSLFVCVYGRVFWKVFTNNMPLGYTLYRPYVHWEFQNLSSVVYTCSMQAWCVHLQIEV